MVEGSNPSLPAKFSVYFHYYICNIQHMKVSIFCSLFNGESFIDGYIEDMLAQSMFFDIEFIIIGCDSDESSLEKFKALGMENVKTFHRPNLPLYEAWNLAISLCSCEYVGNWNIDDRKSCESIELLYNAIARTKSDLVYGWTYVSRVPEPYCNNDFSEIYPCFPYTFDSLLANNSPHCMPLWRKDIHDRYGLFNVEYKCAADTDMWLRLGVNGGKITMINHPVGLYYLNPNGVSTNKERLESSVQEVQSVRKKYI
jgi:glycosyltransferase involved in cell wall biosynthesis